MDREAVKMAMRKKNRKLSATRVPAGPSAGGVLGANLLLHPGSSSLKKGTGGMLKATELGAKVS